MVMADTLTAAKTSRNMTHVAAATRSASSASATPVISTPLTTSADTGVRVFGETDAIIAGRLRSRAMAKPTRVEL
jgi:hypothetical protein